MKKLEIEKTKPTYIILTFKTDIIKVGLVFSISNFFIAKTSLANNWRRKIIPSCSYSTLCEFEDKRRYQENHEKSSATYFSLDFEKKKTVKLFYLLWDLPANLESKFLSSHLNQKRTKTFLYFCPCFKKPLKSGWNKS